MGAPGAPNERQYAQLEKAGALTALAESPATVAFADGEAVLAFALPRQGVSAPLREPAGADTAHGTGSDNRNGRHAAWSTLRLGITH